MVKLDKEIADALIRKDEAIIALIEAFSLAFEHEAGDECDEDDRHVIRVLALSRVVQSIEELIRAWVALNNKRDKLPGGHNISPP